jgi:hypothetical protein
VARERPTASDVPRPSLTCLDGGRPDVDDPRLTRAEARALLRSSPLTYAQLKEHLKGYPEAPPQSG